MRCESWEVVAAENKSDTWINDVPGEGGLLLCEEDWLLQDGTYLPQGTETEIETAWRKGGGWVCVLPPPYQSKSLYIILIHILCSVTASHQISSTGQHFHNFHTTGKCFYLDVETLSLTSPVCPLSCAHLSYHQCKPAGLCLLTVNALIKT